MVGLSHEISGELDGFHTEPDSRNVEYTVDPERDYRALIDQLMRQRCRLRRYLSDRGFTLIPGATLSLDDPNQFFISDPDNPYYIFIRDTYGTDVVTASSHINIGIEEPEELIRAYRVVRCEAAMFLALTASSPFLGGEVTGYHSTRWHVFPLTPRDVPLFRSHRHFIEWMDGEIERGTMQNHRHLWLSVRPNGPATPRDLTRLELRICDRISDPLLVGAVTALLEARVWEILGDPQVDPLGVGDGDEERGLIELAARNDRAVAKDSLDAEVEEWRSGRRLPVRDWIAQTCERLRAVAQDHGFEEQLLPIFSRLDEGNLAQRWLEQHRRGRSPRAILQGAMEELAEKDRRYDPDCP